MCVCALGFLNSINPYPFYQHMSPLVSHPINLWGEMRAAHWLSSRQISPTVSDTLEALIPILEILGFIRHGYLALASVWSTPACCSIQGISSKWRKWMLTDCTHTQGGAWFCHIATSHCFVLLCDFSSLELHKQSNKCNIWPSPTAETCKHHTSLPAPTLHSQCIQHTRQRQMKNTKFIVHSSSQQMYLVIMCAG